MGSPNFLTVKLKVMMVDIINNNLISIALFRFLKRFSRIRFSLLYLSKLYPFYHE